MHIMRTTIDIPEDLIRKAMSVSGAATKRMAVVRALEEMIQRREMRALLELEGKIPLDVDVGSARGRGKKR